MNLRRSLLVRMNDYNVKDIYAWRVLLKRTLRKNNYKSEDINEINTIALEELAYSFKEELKI